MNLAGVTVGRADQRHTDTTFAQVRENASMEDLIVGMCQDNQQ